MSGQDTFPLVAPARVPGAAALLRCSFFAAVTVLLPAGEASAHTVFKRQLQRRYPGLIVKCEACHLKGQPKTEVNDFGKLFSVQMESAKLSARWHELEGEERYRYELEVMKPAFLAALDAIKPQLNPDGVPWGQLLDTGKIKNTKLKKGFERASENAIPDDAPEDPPEDEEEESDTPRDLPGEKGSGEEAPAEGDKPPPGEQGGDPDQPAEDGPGNSDPAPEGERPKEGSGSDGGSGGTGSGGGGAGSGGSGVGAGSGGSHGGGSRSS